ncbi:MAG: diaminopropionate ammonia-lyase, partial [Thermoanaerobaculia bacterium]|nr:diaminopropionate ammonia-lyase [Thermoanaerobaculia bacterium]
MNPATIDYLPADRSAPRRAPSDSEPPDVDFLDPETVDRVRAFHQSVPQYRITPLAELASLARDLGLGAVFVKDEAERFGLGAFKGLGGIYAMARVLAARLGIEERPLRFPHLRQQVGRELGDSVTFVTATAGNHGRGVAWAARQFGVGAVAVVPHGTATKRIEAIRAEGAAVEILGDGFDAAVAAARRLASEQGWCLLQDTAWEGYEEIPRWVMQGYGTMVAESLEQIAAAGSETPTHVVLQVGVGSFAAAVTAGLSASLGRRRPRIYTVEPTAYGPLFASVAANRRRRVDGGPDTPMSCLACTELSTLA